MKRVIGRHKAFLKAFAACGSITKAARAAGVDRHAHYVWLKDLKNYAGDFAEATEQAASVLEDEAVRRAHEGVFEPNTFQGEFVYPTREKVDPETGEVTIVRGRKPLGVMKHSDALMIFLLKGLRPERYRERASVDVSGTVNIEIVERLNAARKRLSNVQPAE